MAGLAVLIIAGLWGVNRWRSQRAPSVWTAGNLLPNADWSSATGDPPSPSGWQLSGDVKRVDGSQGYELTGDYALRMRGSNSSARAPELKASPGQAYRLGFQALVDPGTQTGSTPARLQVWVHWIDAAGDTVRLDKQPPASIGYAADGKPTWTPVLIETDQAPSNADRVAFSIHPLGDDVLYIDNLSMNAAAVYVLPWPSGAAAAVSFSVDWETAMGGYIHTRAGDPYSVEQATAMGLRSRAGTQNLLDLLQAHGFSGTWFGNGYNFLDGNTERRTWMGNPTFAWANASSRWQRDWSQRPWFADDPYGTVASDPGWYFGDLTRMLSAAQQPIESHTFSHLYAGFTKLPEWQADLAAWREVAATQAVAPASALAFPWGSSDGMTAGHWQALEQAGVDTVVRTRLPNNLSDLSDPTLLIDRQRHQPRLLPGYNVLVLPDQQLAPKYQAAASAALTETIASGGVIDLWAHTSEIVDPAEIATWDALMDASQQADVWVASVPSIGAYWRGVRQVQTQLTPVGDHWRLLVRNRSPYDLKDVTLALPGTIERIETPQAINTYNERLVLDLQADASVEIDLWLKS